MVNKDLKYFRVIRRVLVKDAILLIWFVDAEAGRPHKLPAGEHVLEMWGVFPMTFN